MTPGIRSAVPRLVWWVVPPLLVVAAIVAWLVLDPGFRGAGSNAGTAVASDEFGRRVRDYLLEHPEVII